MKIPKIKKFKLSELKAADYNPRTIDDGALEGLANSISRFGCVEPIVVNVRRGANRIIGGHQRLKALKTLGAKEVICVTVSCSRADEKLLNLSLNNPAIQGQFIKDICEYIEKLRAELGDDKDYLALRIDQLRGEIEETKAGLTDDDQIPEPPKKAKTKTGDLYILGEHRLLCGDSTKAEAVERLMGGEKADMVFTDPPYGNLKMMTARKAVEAKVGQYKEYAGHGDFDFRPTWALIRQWDCKKIIWGGNYFAEFLPITTSWLIWDKRSGAHSYFSDCELAWTNLGISAKILSITWQGMIREGEHEPRVHPTQKPIQLAIKTIDEFASDTKCICDLFLGSGSTMIAAEKLGRRCYGMEIDPIYCDVIVKRWERWTGTKAKRERK